MDYRIGTKVFGDWEIVKELGEGSYGKVFELNKTNFGVSSKAALKVIRIPKSTSEIKEALSEGLDEKTVTSYFEDIVKTFVREIAIMSDLKSHPNIVSCEDYVVEAHDGTIGWDILIRMELLTSLQDYTIENKIDEKMVRQLGIDICEALVFCQKKGLIHRDIKPGNIFADSMGHFKLGDFGVARVASSATGGMSKQGTENYMAPEVYYVRPYGASVDIYSLGIVLYKMMNGNRLPFYPPAPCVPKVSEKENALKFRMEGKELPKPINASDKFADIILKACQADPEKRYKTAAEMLAALKGEGGEQEEKKEPLILPDLDDVDDGTENIFGGFSGKDENKEKSERVIPIVDEDDDAGTENIFGDSKENLKKILEEDAEKERQKQLKEERKRKVEEQRKKAEEQYKKRNQLSGNRRELIIKLFNSGELQKIYSNAGTNKKYFDKMNWAVYLDGAIPLQLCSNAIFNIAENEVKKREIVAILDLTVDRSIPGGGGIIFAEDRMYIQLGAIVGDKIPPKAMIKYDSLKTIEIMEYKKFFAPRKLLVWTNKGDSNHYGHDSSMHTHINFDQLCKVMKRLRDNK